MRSTNGSTRWPSSSRRRRCAKPCARVSPRRRISCARCRVSASIAAARAISPPCATDWPRARSIAQTLASVEALPPALQRCFARLREDDGALARDLSQALAEDLPLDKRDGGFVRAGASGAARRGAALARRKPARRRRDAGALRRGSGDAPAQDQAQQFPRLLHRDAAGAGRGAAEGRRTARPSSIARRWPGRCASPPMR